MRLATVRSGFAITNADIRYPGADAFLLGTSKNEPTFRLFTPAMACPYG